MSAFWRGWGVVVRAGAHSTDALALTSKDFLLDRRTRGAVVGIMGLVPPSDSELLVKTSRLILEPVVAGHAEEMVTVLAAPELYKFIRQNPPELSDLRKMYESWTTRVSPQRDELWLNWVARLKSTGELVGHLQAGYKSPQECWIASVVGSRFQRQGFARESLNAIFQFLKSSLKVTKVKAWIDTRNLASVALVKQLGMEQFEFVKSADHFKGSDSDEYVFQITFEDVEIAK